MKNETRYNLNEKVVIYAISIGVGILATIAAMLILAFVSLMLDLGESSSAPLAAVSLAVGAFVSSYLSSKKFKKGGLVNGLICGTAMFIILLMVSLIVDKDGFSLNTLFNFLSVFLAAFIGGISGVGQKRYDKIK